MSLDSLEPFPAGSERIGMASLSRRSLVYSLGGLAYKGVALLTIPLLARLLSPAALGLLDFAAVLATLIGLIAVLGTDQAVAYNESRTESPAGLWGSALAITVAGAAAMLIAAVIFQTPLAQTLTGDPENASVVVAAAVYGGAIALSALALNAVRLRGTPRAYAIASFLLITSEMAVALVLVWLVTKGVALIVLGWAAGALVVLVPLLVRYLPAIARPHMATVRGLLAFGAPLAPVAIAWLVGDSWIRATLAREVELSALGEYGIAYRVASVLGLVVTGFGVAWYPYLYRSPRAEVVPRAADALGKLILALSGLAVALSLLSPEVIAVVAGSAYAGARNAVPALVGGMLGLGVFMLISAVIGTTGSTRRIALAGISGAAVQIAVSQPLVSTFGLSGAALASLAGYTFAALLLAGTESRVVAGGSGMKSGIAVVIAVAGLVAAAWLSGSPVALRLLWLAAFAALLMTVGSSVFGVSMLAWFRDRRTVGPR